MTAQTEQTLDKVEWYALTPEPVADAHGGEVAPCDRFIMLFQGLRSLHCSCRR